jgi:hypothetical protein
MMAVGASKEQQNCGDFEILKSVKGGGDKDN